MLCAMQKKTDCQIGNGNENRKFNKDGLTKINKYIELIRSE